MLVVSHLFSCQFLASFGCLAACWLGTSVAGKEGRETGRWKHTFTPKKGNQSWLNDPLFRAFMTNNPDEFTKDRNNYVAICPGMSCWSQECQRGATANRTVECSGLHDQEAQFDTSPSCSYGFFTYSVRLPVETSASSCQLESSMWNSC